MITGLHLPSALSTLEGQKVRLRPFVAGDISANYISWLNDPRVVRFSNQRFRLHDTLSSEQYLLSFSESDNLFVAITDKTDNTLLGTMTAYANRFHGTVDVGILVGEPHAWGRGVGRDAWNTLCSWLLSPTVGIRKLTAGAARPNTAMIRIMEGFGMHLEAIRSKHEIIEGKAVDLLYYARFNNDA